MQFKVKGGLAAFVVRVILGLIFVVAGCAKALDARSFVISVQQFDVLPTAVILPTAIAVIGCEIVTGLALLVDFQTRVAALLLAALLLSFIVVISLAIVYGRAIDCGCFGSLASEHLGWGIVVRDILLMSGCLWLIVRNNTNDSTTV